MLKKKAAASKGKGPKRKAGGSKLARTEIVQVRLDPKLRFAAELAARKQRRTLSSFIEWAVAEAIANVRVGSKESETAQFITNKYWETSELKRLISLKRNYPHILNFDEERLWDLLVETKKYWSPKKEEKRSLESEKPPSSLTIPEQMFDLFKDCSKGNLAKQKLIEWMKEAQQELSKIDAGGE